MRLLYFDEAQRLAITEDLRSELPSYAILSHRWGREADEVTFQDIVDGTGASKPCYNKLLFCGEQAGRDKLKYFWIDTACIDKSNARELNIAVTSMFRWYAAAEQCYVYMQDVSSAAVSEHNWQAFQASSWFFRGWTLQELLAPARVHFFSHEQHLLGDKSSLSSIITDVTGIPSEALAGAPLHEFSDGERFQWAIDRITTEPEDMAYCLQGIFGVSMLPHYGEGQESAYDRLKDEIIKKHRIDLIKLDVKQRATRRPGTRRRFVLTAEENAAATMLIEAEQLLARRNAIKGYLRFEAIDSRKNAIAHALDKTCGWLLKHDMVESWFRAEHDTFLWLRGHPGAGKSTLMRYLEYQITAKFGCDKDDSLLQQTTEPHNSLTVTAPDPATVIISFYFNARGEILERTVAGLYRSLIVQLMDAVPGLALCLDHMQFGPRKRPPAEFFRDASVPLLQELFAVLIREVGCRIFCLIDALDESCEDDIVEMVYFLQVQAGAADMLTCFSSRHYPTLSIPTALSLTVDHETGHIADIKQYVDTSLQVAGPQAQTIKTELLTKANGIFMWVVLVVGILNKEYRRGDMVGLRARLHRLPPRLGDLLLEISKQGDVAPEHFLLCLQFILYSSRPLSLEEFYYGMLAGMYDDAELVHSQDVSQQMMENFLLTYSKGLAEVTAALASPWEVKNTHTFTAPVQFIHESVRDFLLLNKGLQNICDHGYSENDAHFKLQQCCRSAIQTGRKYIGKLNCSMPLDRLEHTDIIPFTDYAVKFVLHHANSMTDQAMQKDFCQSFEYHDWLLLRSHTSRTTPIRASDLFDVLRQSKCGSLLQAIGYQE